MSETTLPGHAGELHVRTWERDEPERIVVLVHGYGEHIGRYDHVAAAFGERGAVVWGHDHAGHGRSEGERVLVPDFELLVDDLHGVVTAARQASGPELPVVMVSHSMGGMIGTRYAQRHSDQLAGLVISGPILGEPALLAQLLALDEIPDIPIDPAVLSRDESVGQAYADDTLVWHGPFKRTTVEANAAFLRAISQDASNLTMPVLWLHGADDQLVLEAETRAGIETLRAGGATIEEKIYPGARHEIFNETNRDEVLADACAFVERVA
jgi:alpha-beta hydrolase superfamily lysophospholipase